MAFYNVLNLDLVLQEDKSLLVLMESIEEEDIPPGSLPLTTKSKKRHRAEVQRGSCIRLEALKPLAGNYDSSMEVVQAQFLGIYADPERQILCYFF